ncbi:MAG: sulfotransferase family 2 domain-containing protein [Mangrovicoccus sp.]
MDLIARLIENFNSEQEFNYNIHISPDFGFIYFSNPIVACSTLKATLNISTARALGKELTYGPDRNVHARRFGVLLTPRQLGYDAFAEMLANPEVTKFTFVRDPWSRFRSAFTKKLSTESPQAKRLKERLGIEPGQFIRKAIDINQFAKLAMEDHSIRDMDEHWRLQRKQICYDLIPDLQLGRLKHLDEDLSQFIGAKLGDGNLQLFDFTETLSENTSKSRAFQPVVAEGTKELVKQAYAQDYDMLDKAGISA